MDKYIVVGPEGQQSEPVELSTLQTWASTRQLPPHAPIITPEGPQVRADSIAALQPALAYGDQQMQQPYKSKGTKMMPTENPAALWGYYLGIVSMLPILGAILVPFALIYSVKGRKAYKANPEIYGSAHATTGLVTGTIGLIINGLLLMGIVAAMGAASARG